MKKGTISLPVGVVRDLHWMARRYADGRSSYVPAVFNAITLQLLQKGMKLNPAISDGTLWAEDGYGKITDGAVDLESLPLTEDPVSGCWYLPNKKRRKKCITKKTK